MRCIEVSGSSVHVTQRNGSRAVECEADICPTSAVARAVWLLNLIVAEGPLHFTELKERSTLPKATLHRLLNDLTDEDLIRFNERE